MIYYKLSIEKKECLIQKRMFNWGTMKRLYFAND